MPLQQEHPRSRSRRQAESLGEVPRPAARRREGDDRDSAFSAGRRCADFAMTGRLTVVALAFAMPLLAQESGKVADLQFQTSDLQFKVTDFAGNTVAIAGTVQDLEVKEIGNEVRIDLNADVLFDFDKADILPKAEDTLQKAAAIIKERAKGTVMIAGHTDSKGGDAYNMALSERRANAVRDWLRAKGGLSSV